MKRLVRFEYLVPMRFFLFIALMCCPAVSQTAINPHWIAFSRAGAPNSNLQCFRPGNVSVSDGSLVITTKAENASCSSFDLRPAKYKYTSGFVAMRTFNFLYGTVEFRAKFGGGSKTGAWPIVWMEDASCQASDPTGTDDHCNGQEIDIAEILSSDFTHVNQQIHINDFKFNDGCTAATTDTSQNFHLYKLVWSPGSLVFSIDGAVTCSIAKDYVPHSPMYVKVNTFVGNAAGPIKDDSLPWTTLIDYIKVTQGPFVVFSDDFDSASAIQAASAATVNVLPAPRRGPLQMSPSRLYRWLPAMILSMALVAAVVIYLQMGM